MTTPRAGGLASTGAVFSATPKPGAVRAVGNGGSYSFYSIGHHETIGRRITDFLQTTDNRGTFPAPGALHRTAESNQSGVPGMLRFSNAGSEFGVARQSAEFYHGWNG